MKATFELFFTHIGIIVTNPIIFFLISFLGSSLCFSYLQPLVLKRPYMKFEQKSLLAALNGAALVIFAIHLGITSPVFLLTTCPIMIIGELMVMTRDRLFTYVYLWIKLVVNFICIYWLIVSMIGIFSTEYISGEIVFPLTLFTCAWWCYFLSKNPLYPMKELKIMLHRKSLGLVHFAFLTVSLASLLFSTVILQPLIVEGLSSYESSGHIQNMFFIEMFSKTLLVFASGYLILFVQARELRQKESVKALTLDLEKEEHFRRSTQKESFLSFYVNASADQIQEGRDFFTPFMWQDINNYAEMLQKMSFFCIHEEDRPKFVELNTLSCIEEKLERGFSSEKHAFRVRPKQMVELMNLPVPLKLSYLKSEEEWVWVKSKYVYTKDSETGDIYIYVSITDINERMKKSEQLMKDATIDKLTGIYNRAAFQKMVEEKIAETRSEGVSAGTLILIDVDNFKSVNDKLGHPVGDLALQEVAQNLKEIFRNNDIIGRLGGDEFCVFMNRAVDLNMIKERLGEINRRCRKSYPVPEEEPIHVSVSIGAAISETWMYSYQRLYESADQALYYTKENGKNSYSVYQELRKE